MPRYPFTPELLDALPEKLAELYRELEDTLLYEICSRLNISGELNEVTVQSIRALRSHGIDIKDIKKAITKTTNVSRKELDKLFNDVIKRNENYFDEVITLSDITEPFAYVDKSDIDAIRKQTHDEISNITRSMGFYVQQGARKVLLDGGAAYQWALDNAVMQIQSGAISYNQAISSAIKQLADSGLKTISYESGHVDSVDVAVRRAVLTGIVQINSKYNSQAMDRFETDLVEVDAHMGARNTGIGPANHEGWQGKVYRWTEYTDKYPNSSTGEYPDFIETTGYGTGEGLCGWNCRHGFVAFVEGVMEPTYTDTELEKLKAKSFEFEGKQYDTYTATQKQRQIERTIRKLKRRKLSYEAAGDKENATTTNIRIRRLKSEYKAFSKAAGLPEQTERMKVYEPVETNNIDKNFEVSDYKTPQGYFDIEKANVDYKEFLKTNTSRYKIYLENAVDAVTYREDKNAKSPFAYDKETDTIIYNPTLRAFWNYNYKIAITHELGHRYDNFFTKSYNNKNFKNAINEGKSIFDENHGYLQAYSLNNDKDGSFSDILSAICENKYELYAGHEKSYWLKNENKQKDIFANLFSLESLGDNEKLEIIKNYFPEIFKEYEDMR